MKSYDVYHPKTRELQFQGMSDPESLSFPDDYTRVCAASAEDEERAFGRLQHGVQDCQIPEGWPSFSVGSVLVGEGQVLLCLACGWKELPAQEALGGQG